MTDLQDNVAMQQQVQRTEVIRGYSYDICIISGNYGSCSQRLAIRLRLLKFQVLSIMGPYRNGILVLTTLASMALRLGF